MEAPEAAAASMPGAGGEPPQTAAAAAANGGPADPALDPALQDWTAEEEAARQKQQPGQQAANAGQDGRQGQHGRQAHPVNPAAAAAGAGKERLQSLKPPQEKSKAMRRKDRRSVPEELLSQGRALPTAGGQTAGMAASPQLFLVHGSAGQAPAGGAAPQLPHAAARKPLVGLPAYAPLQATRPDTLFGRARQYELAAAQPASVAGQARGTHRMPPPLPASLLSPAWRQGSGAQQPEPKQAPALQPQPQPQPQAQAQPHLQLRPAGLAGPGVLERSRTTGTDVTSALRRALMPYGKSLQAAATAAPKAGGSGQAPQSLAAASAAPAAQVPATGAAKRGRCGRVANVAGCVASVPIQRA